MEDLIRDVWAFALDRADKTPSLSNVWTLMESIAFRESQRAWFSEPPDSVWNEDAMSSLSAAQRQAFDGEFDAQTRSRLGRHFDTTIDRLDLAIPSLLGGPLASKLDAARKRGIAHYEMSARPGRRPARFDWAHLGIDWASLKSFIEQVRTPLFDVAFVVTRGTYALESLAVTNRLYAEDFWSRLQGIGPVNEPSEAVWAEMARVEGLRLQGIIYGV